MFIALPEDKDVYLFRYTPPSTTILFILMIVLPFGLAPLAVFLGPLFFILIVEKTSAVGNYSFIFFIALLVLLTMLGLLTLPFYKFKFQISTRTITRHTFILYFFPLPIFEMKWPFEAVTRIDTVKTTVSKGGSKHRPGRHVYKLVMVMNVNDAESKVSFHQSADEYTKRATIATQILQK